MDAAARADGGGDPATATRARGGGSDREPADADREVARGLAARRGARTPRLPSRRRVDRFVEGVIGLLFPQEGADRMAGEAQLTARVTLLRAELGSMLRSVLPAPRAVAAASDLAVALPAIRERLRADAEAILEGDPAAESLEEVIAAYPGFLAIAVHRIAHQLHRLGAPLLPRLLSEAAHARTGIDIHPGAAIGDRLCIDHGTGIVIGETAVIGDQVKLYQGVTLGALSVAKSAAGSKRHPTIEDGVVIYANATVLGGDTVVGHDSVIGGNVWLTTSVPPYSFVYHSSQIRVRSVADTMDGTDYSI